MWDILGYTGYPGIYRDIQGYPGYTGIYRDIQGYMGYPGIYGIYRDIRDIQGYTGKLAHGSMEASMRNRPILSRGPGGRS